MEEVAFQVFQSVIFMTMFSWFWL